MTAAVRDDGQGPALRDRVAEEVRSWMGRRRMSGAELARKLGKSQTFIARRIDGRQAMDLDDLEMIAEALGISVIELLGDAARRASEDDSGRVDIRAHTHRYAPASAPPARHLRLVRDPDDHYQPVSPLYRSSPPPSGQYNGPIAGDSTGTVNDAHTA